MYKQNTTNKKQQQQNTLQIQVVSGTVELDIIHCRIKI